MRRTDDGIDPLEVADGGRNLQDQIYKNSFFFFVLKFYVPESLGEELQRSSGQKLKDVLAIVQ